MKWEYEGFEITTDGQGQFVADVHEISIREPSMPEAKESIRRAMTAHNAISRVDIPVVMIHGRHQVSVLTYRGASAKSDNTLLITDKEGEKGEVYPGRYFALIEVGSDDARLAQEAHNALVRAQGHVKEQENALEAIAERNRVVRPRAEWGANKSQKALDLHTAIVDVIADWGTS